MRMLACALVACATGLFATTAAAQSVTPAGSVKVNIRIEAPDRTIFNGRITTKARGFVTDAVPGTACDGNQVQAFAPTSPSAVTALNDALTRAQNAFWYNAGTFDYRPPGASAQSQIPVRPFTYGPEVCRIGRYVENTSTGAGWHLRVNNAPVTNAAAPIARGATILWYYGDASVTKNVELKIPSRVASGRWATGRTTTYDNLTGQVVTGQDLQIGAPSRYLKARQDGSFSIKFRTPGLYVIGAGVPNAVRGSARICVYKRGNGDCGTKRKHHRHKRSRHR